MILLFVISLLMLYLYLRVRQKTQCDLPGPKPYPIIGNSLEFLPDDKLGVLLRMTERYGKLFKVIVGSDLCVIMTDPADVEVILSNVKYNSKARTYNFISWLKDGLLTSDGEIWHRHRKLLTPTFHFKILENSMDIMNKHAKILVEQLRPQIAGNEFNVQQFIEKCSLDIISEAAMNVEINSQTSDNDVYFQAVKRVTEITVDRIFNFWLQPDFLFKLTGYSKKFEESLKIMENQSRNVIMTRRNEMKGNKSRGVSSNDTETKKKLRTPFLDWMLTESNFTDEEIHSEVMSFMFAGYDSTNSAISFCLYQLSKYPAVQEKVYAEIMKVLPDDGRCPSVQDFNNLKYTDNVIKETFRLYPPVPMIARAIHHEVCLPSGYKLPANTQLNIFIYKMHRDPEIFSEPEKFRPERFDEERKHPFAYIPFSAGPRNCIGQKMALLEVKMIISTLLKSYQLLPAANDKPLILREGLVLRSKDGIPLRLAERRKSCNK